MIYTVTFNPSLDYIISVDNFKIGNTNRTASERIVPGGKGLNVSTVLWNLGVKSIALGFTAGFTGTEIERHCQKTGFLCDFITLDKGSSRINIKIINHEGTEINGQGPVIGEHDLKKLYTKLKRLSKHDILVLAGSIPPSLPNTVYKDILSLANQKNIPCVIDATGELLSNALSQRPFLIKPNHHELGDLFHVQLRTKNEVIPYAKELQKHGARNVLVSLGKEGAVLVTENEEVFTLAAPEGTLINAVGSGDAMVAGFLAGWNSYKDYSIALKMAVAAGSASAFSETFASQDEIMKTYKKL